MPPSRCLLTAVLLRPGSIIGIVLQVFGAAGPVGRLRYPMVSELLAGTVEAAAPAVGFFLARP